MRQSVIGFFTSGTIYNNTIANSLYDYDFRHARHVRNILNVKREKSFSAVTFYSEKSLVGNFEKGFREEEKCEGKTPEPKEQHLNVFCLYLKHLFRRAFCI